MKMFRSRPRQDARPTLDPRFDRRIVVDRHGFVIGRPATSPYTRWTP